MITIRNHIELLPVFLLLFSPAVVCQEISILPPWYQHNPTLLTNAAADTTPPSSDTLFQILGRWGYGYSYTSKVHGKYAYIGNGASFQIVDITIPNSIQIVGELIIDGIVNNIQISEDYAFVCTGSGLLIIDISLKDRPEKVCFVPLPGGTTKAVVKNKLVYVFSLFGGLKIVDVSIPIQPFIRGSINLIEFPSTLSVADGYVYVGSTEFPGIEVIDATDPDNLISFMYIDVGGVPYSSYLRDTLLFVGTQEDLVILNISEPNSPTLVNTFNFGTQIGAIIGQDSMLYITSSYSNRIYSIDISQTSLPTVKDTLDLFPPGYGLDIDYASPNVIASQYTGVWLINASNSDSLQKASYIPTGGNAQNIFVQNGFAYIASGYSGLWMIDFTEPQKPVSLWNINVGGYTSDVFVKDHFALFVNSPGLLVNDSSRGLWIIDISNPQVPNLISHYTGIIRHSSIWAPPVITVSGDLAFITQAPDGTDSTLEIIDISDPLTPTRKAVHQSPFIPYHITTSDSIAYVATADGGLRVIDWHNPTLPIELPSFNNSTVYSTIGVTSSGKTIFADRVDTFFILDATNPSALNVIGKFGRSYGSYSSIDLAVTDGRVYWADGKLGVVDITDLNSPRELALFPGYGSGSGVDVKGDTILLANGLTGVWLLEYPCTSSCSYQADYRTWYLISAHRSAIDMSKSTLFPSSISSAFTFENGYVKKDTLAFGKGYWIKFNSAPVLDPTGDPVLSETLQVNSGWTLFGGLTYPISIDQINSNPDSIIVSPIYGYDGSYFLADTLYPGRGYWVKISGQGQLFLSVIPTSRDTKPEDNIISILDGKSNITFRNNLGQERCLFFGERSQYGVSDDFYELPPTPPEGIYDIRFQSGKLIEFIKEEGSTEIPLIISSINYPITITSKNHAVDLKTSLIIDNEEIPLSQYGILNLTKKPRIIRLRLTRTTSPQPQKLILYQNYPNPFNPRTNIQFDLPVNGWVTLDVYNILGEKVQTLVDNYMEYGRHVVLFDARSVATGVYFYHLKYLNELQIKFILLLK